MTTPHHIIVLVALLVPLAVDTFVVSTALGLAGLPRQRRLRTSLILAAFEAGMPIVGVLLGRGVGGVIGHVAGYAAAAAIGLAGWLLLRPGGDDDEDERVRLLARAHGLAIIELGLSIGIDELAIGFSLGLLGIPLVLAVVFLGVQAFTASQLGLRLGSRIGEELREGAERAAGALLILIALLLLALELAGPSL